MHKNYFKKIVALTLALLMIIGTLPMMTLTTSAQDTKNAAADGITVGDKLYGVEIGDTLTYTCNLKTDEIVDSISASFTYDSKKLKLLDATDEERFPIVEGYDYYDGKITILDGWYAPTSYDFSQGNALAILKFEVLNNVNAEIVSKVDINNTWSSGFQHYFDLEETIKVDGKEDVPVSDNYLEYKILSSGEVTITGCRANTVDAIIPSEIEGYPVTSIANHAFSQHKFLKSVVIPGSVQNIGNCAFDSCTQLKEVILSDGVKSIGERAFVQCGSLHSIAIPPSVTSIDSTAFNLLYHLVVYGAKGSAAEKCAGNTAMYKIEFVAIPWGFDYILEDDGTIITKFKGDSEYIEIPDCGVKTIATGAFKDMEKLHVYIPTSVKTIEDNAFEGIEKVHVLYQGSSSDWKAISIGETGNNGLYDGERHYNKSYSKNYTEKTIEPTCQHIGYVQHDCKDCDGFYATDKVAMVPHNLKDEVTPPTCMDKGFTTHTCTYCGEETVDNYVDTVEHKVVDGVCVYCDNKFKIVESEHDYKENTNEIYTAYILGAEYLNISFSGETEVEDKYDFIYIYDENDTEIGKYTGTALAGQTVKVMGNTAKIKLVSDDGGNKYGFRAEYAGYIGDELIQGMIGDVNGDEKVNVKDATAIQKYAAKLQEFTGVEALRADVNSDTKVNVKDATAIQKFAAFFETGLPIGEKIA